MPRPTLKKSDINHRLKFFSFSRAPLHSIIAVLMLGISLGVAYEEMFGIGTWHSFHADTEKVNICFTPPSGCGSLIAIEISKATKTIYVQAYGLTSTPIISQLKAAKNRGVRVRVLLDSGNLSNNKNIYNELNASGIDVALDKMPGIAHNKIIIIDEHKVITGSFNFTTSADTRNAENVLLVDDIAIAEQYLINWQNRKEKSSKPK